MRQGTAGALPHRARARRSGRVADLRQARGGCAAGGQIAQGGPRGRRDRPQSPSREARRRILGKLDPGGKARRRQQLRMTIPTVPGRRFSVGKYDIIATPIPYSAHMLRYAVFLNGKRIGATASLPSESDCKFLESPPVEELAIGFAWQACRRPDAL